MAVAVTPPLRIAHTPRGERDRRAAGRVASGVDGIDVVLAGDFVRAGGEVDPLAVAAPGVELFHPIVEGEALQFIRGEGKDIDVAAAGAGGDERELRAVGRIERTRLLGWMCDEDVRFAAGGRGDPDIPSGNERDLGTGGA